MTLRQIANLEEFEERHPGACRQMEAMFRKFFPLRVVAAVAEAQYGEHVSRDCLCAYRWECRMAWGLQMQPKQWTPQVIR
jgi:hypothetical protein